MNERTTSTREGLLILICLGQIKALSFMRPKPKVIRVDASCLGNIQPAPE